MAYSKISICNIALALIGSDAIRDFDEANKRSRMCDVFFEPTRDLILTKFDWPFAKRTALLNQIVVSADQELENFVPYALPSDCLMPRDIDPDGTREKWKVFGKILYRGIEYIRLKGEVEPRLYYTGTEENPENFSDTFVNVLSYGLAAKLVLPITQDKKMAKEINDMYLFQEQEAWTTDGKIGNIYREHDEDPNNDSFVNPDGIAATDQYPYLYR